MVLRKKSFGSAQEIVLTADSSGYAGRESSSSTKLFKNFKQKKIFKPGAGREYFRWGLVGCQVSFWSGISQLGDPGVGEEGWDPAQGGVLLSQDTQGFPSLPELTCPARSPELWCDEVEVLTESGHHREGVQGGPGQPQGGEGDL